MNSDAELVRGVLQGDADAFVELVRRYERLVRAAALNVVRDRHLADDIAQDAFLTAHQTLGSLRQPEHFGAWLLTIAKRRAARVVRIRCRAPISVPDVDNHYEQDGLPLREESQHLLELVERLPDHERVVIGLRHFEGHTVEEIATITGRPVGTVTKQISRAHQRLRSLLAKEVA